MNFTIPLMPLDNAISDSNGKISDAWHQWFLTFYQSLTGILSPNVTAMPEHTTAEITSIGANRPLPTQGALVFNITTNQPMVYIGNTFKNILHT